MEGLADLWAVHVVEQVSTVGARWITLQILDPRKKGMNIYWGVADNTKETTKTMGILLRSFSNDEGPSRVWMALLE